MGTHVVSNFAMNILVNTSFPTFPNVPLEQIPGSGIAGLMENLLDIAKPCLTGTTSPPVTCENVPRAQVILRCPSVENLGI